MKYCFLVGAALALCLSIQADDITPRVGVIEVYGARKVSVAKIRTAIGAKQGDPLPSREDVEERIDKLSGILVSRVEAACCDGRSTILYVGVAERDTPHVDYHPLPTGAIQVPGELADKYRAFLDEVAGSIRGKNADEDLTNGYSLMADPDCRQLQQSFIPLVEANLSILDRVIRESADPDARATAAYLLQYGPRSPHSIKTIIDALQYGLRDDDDSVRQNAMRSLKAIAIGAKLHPEQQIRIEPTWLVELLNSVVWSDRHDASLALVDLTDTSNADTLALIRDRALPSVIEMARWHDLQHALPAFILAGRLAGLNEQEIKTAWVGSADDHEAVLRKALNPNGKRSGFSSVIHHAATPVSQ